MTTTFEPLKTEFSSRDGGQMLFHFKQLKRVGDVAIYIKKGEGVESFCFEVIRVQRHNGFEIIQGVPVAPKEYYPGSKTWGIYGFTYRENEKEKAKKKFAELLGLNEDSSVEIDMSQIQNTNTELELTNSSLETDAEVNLTEAAPTIKRAGRKCSNTGFSFPVGEEWTIAQLAEKYKVSIPYVYLRINAAGIKPVKTIRKEGTRGKPSGVFFLETAIPVPDVSVRAK